MLEHASLIIPAFVAGIIMFIAPCTLALVPGFLAYISGPTDMTVKKNILKSTVFFIFGFSVIFIFFGVFAGLAGKFLMEIRETLEIIGGILLILFGLMSLGVFKLSIIKSQGFPIPKWLERGNPLSTFLVGASFAIGWTPCIGPIVASILLLAGSAATAFEGGILLTVFSLGLAIPFLLVALWYRKASEWLQTNNFILRFIALCGGMILIIIGVLLLSNSFYKILTWGYSVLEFFGVHYQSIEKFL